MVRVRESVLSERFPKVIKIGIDSLGQFVSFVCSKEHQELKGASLENRCDDDDARWASASRNPPPPRRPWQECGHSHKERHACILKREGILMETLTPKESIKTLVICLPPPARHGKNVTYSSIRSFGGHDLFVFVNSASWTRDTISLQAPLARQVTIGKCIFYTIGFYLPFGQCTVKNIR